MNDDDEFQIEETQNMSSPFSFVEILVVFSRNMYKNRHAFQVGQGKGEIFANLCLFTPVLANKALFTLDS